MKIEMVAGENMENENSKITAMEELTSSSKRRKICEELSSTPHSEESVIKSDTPSLNSEEAIDLKHKNPETEVCMISNDGEFSGETSKSKELCGGDLRETMEQSSSSTTETNTSLQLIRASPTPLAAEIEEFFAAAEKYEHKRFSEKYNYDIVNDVPLEGRYKWIPLKL